MLIARRSLFTGNINQMDLPITDKQLQDYFGGMLIQHAFPQLTPAEREFIKTGVTSEEWDNVFALEE